MWFVLVFGVVTLGAAARFAWKPTIPSLAFVRGMAATTLLTAVMGVAADLAAVGHHLNERWDEWKDQAARVVAQGFAESMAPGVMGAGLVAMAALLMAVGAPRLAKAGS